MDTKFYIALLPLKLKKKKKGYTVGFVKCFVIIDMQCLLALSSVLGGASALLLLAVPVGRITVTFPPLAELMVTCNNTGMQLRHMNDYACLPLHPYSYDINVS